MTTECLRSILASQPGPTLWINSCPGLSLTSDPTRPIAQRPACPRFPRARVARASHHTDHLVPSPATTTRTDKLRRTDPEAGQGPILPSLSPPVAAIVPGRASPVDAGGQREIWVARPPCQVRTSYLEYLKFCRLQCGIVTLGLRLVSEGD